MKTWDDWSESRMKTILLLCIHNIPAILCAIAAGILAYNGIEGWGWFLAVTALTCAIRVNTGRREVTYA